MAPISHFEAGNQNDLPVLFLHGFMGSHADWLPFVTGLHRQHRCIVPDLPGHGRTTGSRAPGSYSVEATVTNLRLLLREKAIARCVLVGYSMGGRIALRLAVEYPELISRLVLLSSSPGLENESDRVARVELDEERARSIEQDLDAFLENWYNQDLFTGGRSTIPWLRRTLSSRVKNDAQDLARSLREAGSGRQEPLWNRLPSFKMPITLLVGSLDEKYVDLAKRMLERCTDGKLIEVNNAAHAIHLDQPEVVLSHLNKELSGTKINSKTE